MDPSPQSQEQEVGSGSLSLQDLPNEIQMAIFKEALQKPAVHFLNLDKLNNGERWSVRMSPMAKRTDPSGYRYLHGLSTVCANARAAVKWATIESQSIRFSMLPNIVDAATDLFVMEFRRHRDPSLLNNNISDCFWNPMNQVIDPRFNRGSTRQKFRHMRKVGVTYKSRHEFSGAVGLRGYSTPFKCLWGHNQSGICGFEYRVCPVELAGFMDCFPDLETFYIIIFIPRHSQYKKAALEYRDIMISPPVHQRPNPSLEVLHDSNHTYMELVMDQCSHVWEATTAIEILRKAKAEWVGGNMWTTPLQQRRRVEVKVLAQVPIEK